MLKAHKHSDVIDRGAEICDQRGTRGIRVPGIFKNANCMQQLAYGSI